MKTFIGAAVLLVSSMSMALPLKVPQMTAKAVPQPAVTQCADFTGYWVGVCEDSMGDEPYETEFEVVQKGCESLIFKDEDGDLEVAFGGMANYVDKDAENPLTISLFVDWFENASSFRLRYSIATRRVDTPQFYRGYADADYLIDGDTLVQRTSGESLFEYNGQRSPHTYAEECRYTRGSR